MLHFCWKNTYEHIFFSEQNGEDARFRAINNDDIAKQSRPFVPANTIRKTEWAKNLYNSWCCSAKVNAEEEECNILRKGLLSLSDDEILFLFPKFVMSMRRKVLRNKR